MYNILTNCKNCLKAGKPYTMRASEQTKRKDNRLADAGFICFRFSSHVIIFISKG